jgi:hypothetical protein
MLRRDNNRPSLGSLTSPFELPQEQFSSGDPDT